MSVDLLRRADVQQLSLLHDTEAQSRVPPRIFHGWYVFSAATVRSVGWNVTPAKTDVNPWHAEVILSSSVDEEDAFIEHCEKIAASASWKVRPMSRSDEEFLEQAADSLD